MARPIYESLPALYAVIGGVALMISYLEAGGLRAVITFGIGVFAEIAALTLFLRRRDSRELLRDYSGGAIDLPLPPADLQGR